MPHGVRQVEGVDRIRQKLAHNELLRQVQVEVSALLREAPKVEMTRAKLPGDHEALRGLPAIGRNVAGEIKGTRPDREVVRRLSRNGR